MCRVNRKSVNPRDRLTNSKYYDLSRFSPSKSTSKTWTTAASICHCGSFWAVTFPSCSWWPIHRWISSSTASCRPSSGRFWRSTSSPSRKCADSHTGRRLPSGMVSCKVVFDWLKAPIERKGGRNAIQIWTIGIGSSFNRRLCKLSWQQAWRYNLAACL